MNKTLGHGGSTRLSRRVLKLAAAHSKVPVNIESLCNQRITSWKSRNYFELELKQKNRRGTGTAGDLRRWQVSTSQHEQLGEPEAKLGERHGY